MRELDDFLKSYLWCCSIQPLDSLISYEVHLFVCRQWSWRFLAPPTHVHGALQSFTDRLERNWSWGSTRIVNLGIAGFRFCRIVICESHTYTAHFLRVDISKNVLCPVFVSSSSSIPCLHPWSLLKLNFPTILGICKIYFPSSRVMMGLCKVLGLLNQICSEVDSKSEVPLSGSSGSRSDSV